MITKDVALGALYAQKLLWNLPLYLQNCITPRDSINLIQPWHMYTETENWQTKKELLV
jgi:hypothetical protein